MFHRAQHHEYSGPNILAHVLEKEQAQDKLESYTLLNDPLFYHLMPNPDRKPLIKQDQQIKFPPAIQATGGSLTVFDPGFSNILAGVADVDLKPGLARNRTEESWYLQTKSKLW